MITPNPSLPFELIEECLYYLPACDIAQCLAVSQELNYRIEHNSELQLQLHARRYKIQRPNRKQTGYPEYSFREELQRLRANEANASRLSYGQRFPQTKTLQLATTNADFVHLATIANGYVFLPLVSPGIAGFTGIVRHRLDAFEQPPDILNLGRTIRYFQTDAADEVLFVVFLQGHARDAEICLHSLEMYSTTTLTSLKLPRSGLVFSASRATQPMDNVHNRASILSVTSESMIPGTGKKNHFINVYHRYSRDKLLCYKTSEAEHVVSRVISAHAMICLELNAMSAHLHLFALNRNGKRTETDPFKAAFSVARYALPTLPRGFTYVRGGIECTPLGLSFHARRSQNYHLVYDGSGIIYITLEVRSSTGPAAGVPGITGGSTEVPSRNFTTACCSVQPFQKQVAFAWTKKNAGLKVSTAYYTYQQWALDRLSWLPRHPNPPTSAAICGHRLMVPEKLVIQPGQSPQNGSSVGAHKVAIYDFSPYNVNEAMCTGFQGDGPEEQPGPESSNMLTVRPLPSTTNDTTSTQSDICEEGDLQRCLVLTSGPGLVGLEHMASEYITKAPYIAATRSIQIHAPGVECIAHFSYEQLLLVLQAEGAPNRTSLVN